MRPAVRENNCPSGGAFSAQLEMEEEEEEEEREKAGEGVDTLTPDTPFRRFSGARTACQNGRFDAVTTMARSTRSSPTSAGCPPQPSQWLLLLNVAHLLISAGEQRK